MPESVVKSHHAGDSSKTSELFTGRVPSHPNWDRTEEVGVGIWPSMGALEIVRITDVGEVNGHGPSHVMDGWREMWAGVPGA